MFNFFHRIELKDWIWVMSYYAVDSPDQKLLESGIVTQSLAMVAAADSG
jgi:hypothetical protein